MTLAIDHLDHVAAVQLQAGFSGDFFTKLFLGHAPVDEAMPDDLRIICVRRGKTLLSS